MSDCVTKYLDGNNEMSVAYYSNFHKGHDVALAAYLQDMVFYAAKHQVSDPASRKAAFDLMLKNGKPTIMPDESNGTYRLNGIEHNRTTEVSQEAGNVTFDEMTIAAEDYWKIKARAELLNSPIGADGLNAYGLTAAEVLKISTKPGLYLTSDKRYYNIPALKTWRAENMERSNKGKEPKDWLHTGKIREQFKYKRLYGNVIHHSSDVYITERNKITDDGAKPFTVEMQNNLMTLVMNETRQFISDGSNPPNPGDPSIEAADDMDGMKISDDAYKTHLRGVENWIQSLGEVYKIVPEMVVYNSDAKIAGRADVVVVGMDGRVHIYDYKTKAKDSIVDFVRAFDNMEGVFSGVSKSKAGMANIQTSIYRAMFESHGVEVSGATILRVIGNFNNSDPILGYTTLQDKAEANPTTYLKSEVVTLLQSRGYAHVEERIADVPPGTINSPGELVDVLFEGKLTRKIDVDKTVTAEMALHNRSYYYDAIAEKKVYYRTDNKSERESMFRAYMKEYASTDRERAVALSVIDFFNTGFEVMGNGKKASLKTRALSAMRGIHKDTHSVELVASIPGMSHAPTSLILARNLITGVASIIDVQTKDNIHLTASKGSIVNPQTSIFKNHLTDYQTQTRFGMKGFSAESDNLRLIRAGIVMAELAHAGHITKASTVSVSTVNGSRDGIQSSTTASMKQLESHIMATYSIAEDNLDNKPISKRYQEVKKSAATLAATTAEDVTESLIQTLAAGSSGLSERQQTHLADTLVNRRDLPQAEYIQELIKLQRIIAEGFPISGDNRESNLLELKNNPDYVAVCKVILSTLGYAIESSSFSLDSSWENTIRSLSKYDNENLVKVVGEVDSANRDVSYAGKRRMKIHNNAAQKVKKDNFSESKSNPFANCYVNQASINRTAEGDAMHTESLMILKDPKDSSLTESESAFITMFNQEVREMHTKNMSDRELEEYDLDEGASWDKGQVPIMNLTSGSRTRESEGVFNKIKSAYKTLVDRSTKMMLDTLDDVNLLIESRFKGQVTTSPGVKAGLLGLEVNGSPKEGGARVVETNLEIILGNMTIDDIRVERLAQTAGIMDALSVMATIAGFEDGKDTKAFSAAINSITNLGVKKKYKEEKYAGIVDRGKGASSKATFALSITHWFMELATSISATTGSVVNETMAGKNKRYSGTNLLWAEGFIDANAVKTRFAGGNTTNMVNAIADAFHTNEGEYGALTADKQFATGSQDATDVGYIAMRHNMHHFRNTHFIAGLKHRGVMGAMSLDKDGNLAYDWKLDPRYSDIVRADGQVISNPTTDKEKSQYSLFIYQRAEQTIDGTIDKDGNPLMPINNKEVLSDLDNIKEILGGNGLTATATASESYLGRLALGYRGWVVPKKDMYWTPSGVKSALKGRTVMGEDGVTRFVDMSSEGIIQTVWNMGRDFIHFDQAVNLNSRKEIYTKLDMSQKENLRKLLAHAMVALTLGEAIKYILEMDEVKDSGVATAFGERFQMGIRDLNIMQVMYGASSGGWSPVFSSTVGKVTNLIGAVHGYAMEDAVYTNSNNSRLAKTVGAVNLLSVYYGGKFTEDKTNAVAASRKVAKDQKTTYVSPLTRE